MIDMPHYVTKGNRFNWKCKILNFLYRTFTIYAGAGHDMKDIVDEVDTKKGVITNISECIRCGRKFTYKWYESVWKAGGYES